MKDLTIIGSFTPRRKITSLEGMTFRDWAEVTMDFLAFCKPLILGYKGDWYKSSLSFGLDTEEGTFRELDEIARNHIASCIQRIEWQKFALPQNISSKTMVYRLEQYKSEIGEGEGKSIVITKDAQLLICKTKFAFREKIKDTSINYATECVVEIGTDETLTGFFTEMQIDASGLLDRLCTHTKDLIRLEQERVADERVKAFTKAFEENIIARWGVTT